MALILRLAPAENYKIKLDDTAGEPSQARVAGSAGDPDKSSNFNLFFKKVGRIFACDMMLSSPLK